MRLEKSKSLVKNLIRIIEPIYWRINQVQSASLVRNKGIHHVRSLGSTAHHQYPVGVVLLY